VEAVAAVDSTAVEAAASTVAAVVDHVVAVAVHTAADAGKQ
jgi:hypothetical protein